MVLYRPFLLAAPLDVAAIRDRTRRKLALQWAEMFPGRRLTVAESTLNVPLRIATFNVIRQYGIGILKQHRRFIANVIDELDPEAKTTEPFERNCTPDVLQIYYDAARQHTPEAIDGAAQKTTLLLTERRMLQEAIATRLACELAFGVGAALGIGCSEDVRTKATRDLAATAAAPREQSRPQVEQSPGTAPHSTSTTSTSHAPNPEQSRSGSRQSVYQSASRSAGASNASQRPAPTPQNVASQRPAPAPQNVTPPQTPGFSPDPKIRRKQAIEQGISLGWNGFVRLWCGISAAVYYALTYNALLPGSNPLYGTAQYWAIRGIILVILATMFVAAASALGRFKRSGLQLFVTTCLLSTLATFMHFGSLPAEAFHPSELTYLYGFNILSLIWMLISLAYYNGASQKACFLFDPLRSPYVAL